MKYYFTLLFLFSVQIGFSQSDEPNCKDHSLLPRYAGSFITFCSTGEDAVEFQLSDTVSDMKSGKRFFARYGFPANAAAKAPDFSQVEKHFEAQIVKNKGRRIFHSDSLGTSTFLIPGKIKDLWIMVNDNMQDGAGNYELVTVEADANKKVTAIRMLDDLSTKGSTIVYFTFDNDKNVISSETQKYIDVIVDLLQTETELNISIEGHTDNTGYPAENQRLSESRAKSVYDVIVLKGVDSKRLKVKGWGREKPIFDNSSEDGKEKNNRIELVKLKPE